MPRFRNVTLDDKGSFAYTTDMGSVKNIPTRAGFPRFLIREAWDKGCSFEDLADGFGKGRGTCGGDWSGIRDSSKEAIDRMLERALNHLFPSER